MSIIVDYGIGDVTGVFDVDVVADSGGKREGIVRNPEGRLHCRVVSYFGVGSHPHRVEKPINHGPKSHIAVLRQKYISVNSSIGSNMGGGGEGEAILVNMEDISVPIDRLEVGNIVAELRSLAVEGQTRLSKHPSNPFSPVASDVEHQSPRIFQH